MSADTCPTPPRRTWRKPDGATVAVFSGLVANAATAFLIQAWMTFGFAARVWRIPVPLCVSLIIALDVFAIMFMVLTYLLRGTGWPRGVATAVFLFAVGTQVFAAELFADHEHWIMPVRFFSALPAVFLALAQEGVILWRSHRGDLDRRTAEDLFLETALRRSAKSIPTPPVPAGTDGSSDVGVLSRRVEFTLSPQPTTRPAAVATTPARPGPSARRPRQRGPEWADVIKRCLDRDPPENAKRVAHDLGVNVRTAQLWVKDERKRRARGVTDGADGTQFPDGSMGRLYEAGDVEDVPPDALARTVSDDPGGASASASGPSSDAPVP